MEKGEIMKKQYLKRYLKLIGDIELQTQEEEPQTYMII